MKTGTPRELLPIADQVLAWIVMAKQRGGYIKVRPDELRRIELCAQATREASMFFDLYGIKAPE